MPTMPALPVCPYCHNESCRWTISAIGGTASAEVHSACGHSISVDGLLGQARWHLEAARKTVEGLHESAPVDPAPQKRQAR